LGYKCGCISKDNEHCRRNPLHSSATPEYGAGLAIGLEIVEEATFPEVGLGEEADAGVRACLRISTSSWKGSVEVMSAIVC
jgi:hypothetical protein